MKNWEGSDKLWMNFFDSIYYIVQLIFNFFRFLIIWGCDTKHNKKESFTFCIYLCRPENSDYILIHKQIFHCDRIFCYYWFKLQFIQYVYLLPPFLIRFFFFLYQTSNVDFESIQKYIFCCCCFSLLKTNKINSSINWMSNTYAEFDIR